LVFALVAGIRDCGLCLRRALFFAFALASAMRLAARALPLCGAALAFVCNGLCFDVFAVALASAMRLAARALPLCGAAPTLLCRGKEE